VRLDGPEDGVGFGQHVARAPRVFAEAREIGPGKREEALDIDRTYGTIGAKTVVN
jgi:hypothetical protein